VNKFRLSININDPLDPRNALIHGIGAAAVSLFAWHTAHVYLHLREAYWAPITVAIVLQPGFQLTKKASWDRVLGTTVGALIGWGTLAWWNNQPLRYALGIFIGIAFCWLIRQPNAARTCAVAITVITLIPHVEPAYRIAFFRFTEVTYGVICALVYSELLDQFLKRLAPPPSKPL
jgi:uncharacterized membrane protein YgaE (UPF0421/DUF939 family)